MGFSISEMYEQTGIAFYLSLNFFISVVYLVLLFPSDIYQRFLVFLTNQIVDDGKMQSGNISVIFIGILILMFLLNHLSNWTESVLFPKMSISPINFDYLIARRFWNIATLYNKNSPKGLLVDTINDSFVSIFSVENPKSEITRIVGVRQRKWRFYKVFAGTFKLAAYCATVLAVYHLFYKCNFILSCYYFAIAIGSLLLWFGVDILLCNVVWSMFNSFWGYQKVSSSQKDSYLDRLFNHNYLIFWKDSFKKITFKQRLHDLTSGRTIRWK